MRKRYLWRGGQWVDVAELCPSQASAGPTIVRDQMDELRHPATGQITDSKSHFRRMTREAGCIEVGTSEMPEQRREMPDARRDVGEAYQMLNQGYRPNPMSYAEFDD